MPELLNLRKKINRKAVRKAKTTKTKQRQKELPVSKHTTLSVVESAGNVEQDNQSVSSLIAWEITYNPHSQEKKYLLFLAVFLVIGGVVFLFFKIDIILAVFLSISSLVLFLYYFKKSETLFTSIDNEKIIVGETVYLYKDLKSFWIEYNPKLVKELSIESKRWYSPYVKIPLEDKDPAVIRSVLIKFLPEIEHENSIADEISRKIGL